MFHISDLTFLRNKHGWMDGWTWARGDPREFVKFWCLSESWCGAYDYFSTSLSITKYGFIQYIVTRQRALPHFSVTMQRPWRSLRSLNTSSYASDFSETDLHYRVTAHCLPNSGSPFLPRLGFVLGRLFLFVCLFVTMLVRLQENAYSCCDAYSNCHNRSVTLHRPHLSVLSQIGPKPKSLE